MTRIFTGLLVGMFAVVSLTSCGNTIRGVGKDASNTVDATKHAVKDVAN